MALVGALLGSGLPQASAAAGPGFSFTPSKTEPYAVCGRATAGHSACTAIIVPAASALSSAGALLQAAPQLAKPALSGTGVGGGYAPADLRSAYNLPSDSAGSGQTVAIVDAFDDPKAESDLGVYRSHYGLPACTTANGCFRKVNQKGETNYPTANAGWAVEISLDIDMVSAACPNCHILLVEATNSTNTNLYAAEDEAATLGATEISNSYEGGEVSGETTSDTHFNHPGVPIFASAGDAGYGVRYPAASQYVIAVGGTVLTKASNSRGWSETVWNGTGSGCSAFEPKPAWQTGSPKCTKRTNNDIAAVASPETPVSVADSYELPKEFEISEPGWTLVGGTSVSSPLMAGTMALANAHTRSFGGADAYYKEAAQNGTGVLTDVTSGTNTKTGEKNCGNYLCNGEVGYDGPTGLGSPYGAPVVLPEPPAVVTKAASALTQTTATLNATVNPNEGEVSKCEFEYGTTTSYGQSAPCATPPGSGNSPVAVSAAVTGLVANTTYHVRVSATNAGGTTKGSDETFKTLASPPTIATCTITVTQTTARLCATVNPNGGEVSKCEFEYGTMISYGSSAPCNPPPGSGTKPVEVSAEVTGLTPNTIYHFRVTATNPSGTSDGSDATFKTLANPPTVVTKPASLLTPSSATLNATVNPNGGEVSECEFEYGTSNAYGSTVPCTPAKPGSGTNPVEVSAEVTGLSPNATYHFRISATNPSGTSKGTDETLTTTANPPTVLTEAATAVTNSSAALNATVNPNGVTVSECKLEYGTTTSYGQSAPCTPPPGSGSSPVAVSAQAGFLNGGTTYHFRISATEGGTATGSDQTFTTLSSPHWQKNGTKAKEGEQVGTISWGTVTLEYSATTVTCRTASAANIENTPTAAKAETELFATYECKAAGGECVAKGGETRVGVPALPWLQEIKEEGEGTELYREENAGIQLNIECYKAGVLTEHALFKSGAEGAETGTFTPALLNGATAERPSEVSFDTSSGHLLSETGGLKLTTRGKLKVEGLEGAQVPLITVGPNGAA